PLAPRAERPRPRESIVPRPETTTVTQPPPVALPTIRRRTISLAAACQPARSQSAPAPAWGVESVLRAASLPAPATTHEPADSTRPPTSHVTPGFRAVRYRRPARNSDRSWALRRSRGRPTPTERITATCRRPSSSA